MYRCLRKTKTMKVHTFTTRLIQLHNCPPYFPADCMGQIVTALPDDEVKDILYQAMPNTWRKILTVQGYNYQNRSFQEMSGFFITRVENLCTSAPPPAIRSLSRKKKKKTSKKQKAVTFEDSDDDSSEHEKPSSWKKFCQYRGKFSHSTDKCFKVKAQIKTAKSNKSNGYKQRGEKTCTKHVPFIILLYNIKQPIIHFFYTKRKFQLRILSSFTYKCNVMREALTKRKRFQSQSFRLCTIKFILTYKGLI